MFVHRLRAATTWTFCSFRARTAVLAASLAAAVFQVLHLWIVVVGLGGTQTIALLAGGLTGFLVAHALPRTDSKGTWSLALGLHLAVLALIRSASGFWSLTCFWSAGVDPTHSWLTPFLASFWLVVPCAILFTLILRSRIGHSTSEGCLPGAIWIPSVIAMTLTGLVFVLAPWVTTFSLELAAAIGTAVYAAISWLMTRQTENASTEASVMAFESQSASEPIWTGRQWILSALAACLCGMLAALAFAVTRELVPVAIECIYAVLTGAVLGWPLGGMLARRFGANRSSIAGPVLWILAVSLPAILFPEFVRGMLYLNSHLSQGWFVLLVRAAWFGLQTGMVVCGLRLTLCGVTCATQMTFQSARVLAVCGFAGVAIVFAMTGSGMSLGTLIAGSTLAFLGLQIASFLSMERTDANWARIVGGVVFGCVAIAVIGAQQRLAPTVSTRLLFSTEVMSASLQGQELATLLALDEGRAVAQVQTSQGSLTVWKYRGVQYRFHQAGIPDSVMSFDTRVCPQFSGEILPTLLGMTLHQDPQSVCLLGASGGVPVQTALSFPVRNVTCIEPSGAKLDLLMKAAWSAGDDAPIADERLNLSKGDPVAEMAAPGVLHDVIVATSGQSGLASDAAMWTREHFADCARRLTADGVLCVRFRQVDYGPEPMQVLARTIRSVFAHTGAFEVAPGEIAFVATNSERGLLRSGLIERCERSQVQHVLNTMGWDWVKLMQLPWYGEDRLEQLAGVGAVHSRNSGLLSFRLGRELLRWGPKGLETEEVLKRCRGQLLDHLSPGHKLAGEIQNRIREVRAQTHLMRNYPDEPWAYRKKLKEFLQTQPRTSVQLVSGGDEMTRHPVDRQRMGYLTTLAKATRSRTPESIRLLSAFEYPSDPLLSFFMHREVAELYERSPQRDLETEFRHRLHAIYYADPSDRSVRDVAKAIHLLADYPTTVEDPQTRRDHLDALIQMLKVRWDSRNSYTPDSADIALNDIEVSLEALNVGMEEMDGLTEQLQLPKQQWEIRRQYLDRVLTRSLRTYRSRLLPHHQKELYKREKEAAASAEDA